MLQLQTRNACINAFAVQGDLKATTVLPAPSPCRRQVRATLMKPLLSEISNQGKLAMMGAGEVARQGWIWI